MNRNVLFVDDDRRYLAAMHRNFQDRISVLTAADGHEALDVLSNHRVAAVVADYRMPGMNGLQLLDRVRTLSPATRRILLTGYPDVELAMTAVNESSISFFLAKPSPTAKLLNHLERALAEYNVDATAAKVGKTPNRAKEGIDETTACWTRQHAEQHLRRLDTAGIPYSFLLVDIDGLRNINHAHGYAVGDQVLKTLGMLLKSLLEGPDDVLARWAEDTFLLGLANRRSLDMEPIIGDLVARARIVGDTETPIPICYGLAALDEGHDSVWDCIAAAETHLLEDKMIHGSDFEHATLSLAVRMLGEHSAETQGHVYRMKAMAELFADALNFNNAERDRLVLLALLHDIGKIAVPDSVLEKPGPLTLTEWTWVQHHVEAGYRMAKAFPHFAGIAEEILYHHERWDGTGYPRGLAGDEIPLLARAISVIDAFDVMTHERPYKMAMDVPAALKELKTCSGSQFDPRLTEEFLTMIYRLKPAELAVLVNKTSGDGAVKQAN